MKLLISNYTLFYKQSLFSTQTQCCLTFQWIEPQMLLKFCLIHIYLILEWHFSDLIYFCLCLQQGLFLYYPYEPRVPYGSVAYKKPVFLRKKGVFYLHICVKNVIIDNIINCIFRRSYRRCSVKKLCSSKFLKFHKKTTVLESFFW